ncbi:MAG TPA: hypothetical protein VKG80_01495 [Trebonia sp.]|nr:hypothetical protein [Trebonia sp.]
MSHRAIASALVTLATVLGVTAATATAAAAAPAKAAAAPAARTLLGVSCRTAANCLAVGVDQNAFKGMGGPLAEKWNGRAWQTIAVKLPAGATGGALGRISCVSATHCVAVGFFDKGAGNQFALADTWNGSSWTPSQPPAPGGSATSLSGVSCKSATACVAVGAYTKNTSGGAVGAPLAETWNGRKWSEARPPVPAGTDISGLDSVSCTSAASCIATGIVLTSTVSAALIESWNGRTWSRMKAAALPATTLGELISVSCPAAKSCAAVGYASSPKGLGSLAETWNGKAWTLTTVHWPKGTSNELLPGVSCVAGNRCVAVGTIDSNLNSNSNTGKAAAATWNGRAWTVTSVPAPARGKASLLNDVTCLSASNCVAVGQAGPAGSTNGTGLSAFWNGKSWRLVAAK